MMLLRIAGHRRDFYPNGSSTRSSILRLTSEGS